MMMSRKFIKRFKWFVYISISVFLMISSWKMVDFESNRDVYMRDGLDPEDVEDPEMSDEKELLGLRKQDYQTSWVDSDENLNADDDEDETFETRFEDEEKLEEDNIVLNSIMKEPFRKEVVKITEIGQNNKVKQPSLNFIPIQKMENKNPFESKLQSRRLNNTQQTFKSNLQSDSNIKFNTNSNSKSSLGRDLKYVDDKPKAHTYGGMKLRYSFPPYVEEEDELEGKDTMDYVKGIGVWYIFNNASYVNHEFNARAPMKTILLYNPFYADDDYRFGLGSEPFKEHMCIINRCRAISDLSQMNKADMIIFFAHGLDYTKPKPIPQRSDPKQIFVFWNHESPFYRTRNKLKRFKNAFNLTVTYRDDSSVPLPLYQTRARVSRKLHPLVSKYHLRSKTKLVVWMISACHKIGSLRVQYTREMAKYIPIDTYGDCGDKVCPRDQTQQCLDEMEQTYKFYLAFENSICKDYITEKPFRTLVGNWVPIVMGGGDYKKHLPPHSFIDVRDFESPRHLAEYLIYLDNNDEEYLKYFDWKKDWIVWRVHTKVALCELCRILHEGSDRLQSDLDIHDWWEVQGQCIEPDKLPTVLHLNTE